MDKVPTTRRSKLPWAGILNLLAAVLYGASPIDLIPDIIPLLGLLDDAIAVPLFILLAIIGFRSFKKYQREESRQPQVVDVASREPQIPTSPY